jgi:hypothetical protein
MSGYSDIVPHYEHLASISEVAFMHDRLQGSWNIAGCADAWIRETFSLALLHWGHGAFPEAVARLEQCARVGHLRNEAFVDWSHLPETKEAFASTIDEYVALSRLAAFLIDACPPAPVLEGSCTAAQQGGEPWFIFTLIQACVDGVAIEPVAFDRSCHLWKDRGYSGRRLEDWIFYRSVLEGEWQSQDVTEMFQRHAQLYQRRKKLHTAHLMTGEGSLNDLVVDSLFAAVLKRVGWQGSYRHAWPDDGIVPPVGSIAITRVAPHRFLKSALVEVAGLSMPKPFSDRTYDEAIFAIEQVAPHLCDGSRFRPRLKLDARALAGLGIRHKSEEHRLLSAIDPEVFPTRRSHGQELGRLEEIEERTRHLRESNALHPELVILSLPEHTLQWEEPEGAVFAFRPADGRVYLADAEDLGDAAKVVASAEPGISVWPSIASFLVWFVGEEKQAP